MQNDKFIVVAIVLVIVQGLSAGICWLMFEEFFVASTLIGSVVPAALYLRIVK